MSTAVFEPTRKLLESTFQTAWANRTPIQFENVSFAQPGNAAYVGFYIRWGEAAPVSCGTVGTRMERHSGAILIMVYGPKNSGQKDIEENCDFASAIFRMRTLRDDVAGVEVVCRSPSQTDKPAEDELLLKMISIAFQVDALF